ncbi:MAG: Fur family transcriptional regulator [Exilibacterium sp.]
MTDPRPIACQPHNHQLCIDDAVASAQRICKSKGARLTPLRKQVLILVWQSHRPLGAYTIMDMLAQTSTRRVAPPTVYRALDFLLQYKLIHRINSLNAFLGCPDPGNVHQNYFLICRQCGIATECLDNSLGNSIAQVADSAGFQVKEQSVEIVGLCPRCQAGPKNREPGQ